MYCVDPHNVYEYAYVVDVTYISTNSPKGRLPHEELGRAIVSFKPPLFLAFSF